MKGVILVLMVLMAAVFFAALACGQNALSIPGYEVSRTPATDADTKKIEDRMNEALSGLIIHRPAAIDNKITAKGLAALKYIHNEFFARKFIARKFFVDQLFEGQSPGEQR